MNRRHVAFGITLFRGTLALALGVGLLIQPDKARPMLANFMGMFWLASGIVSLRRGVSGQRAKGRWLLAGIIGVLAGIAVLGRKAASNYVAEEVIISLLGLVIVLTGVLHIFGGFRTGDERTRQWSWTSFLLGVFEVILGLLLAVEPLQQGTGAYLAASVWALVGGFILISDAVRLRRQRTANAAEDG